MAASPLVGFGDPPSEINFSILDYHGLIDDTIPYSAETSFGNGPHDSIIAYDGFYYANKVPYLAGNIKISNFDFNFFPPNFGSSKSHIERFCRMV